MLKEKFVITMFSLRDSLREDRMGFYKFKMYGSMILQWCPHDFSFIASSQWVYIRGLGLNKLQEMSNYVVKRKKIKMDPRTLPQTTSNRVSYEARGTYPLNPMSDNVTDGKFVCPMIEGNHHGTNQSEMHQI